MTNTSYTTAKWQNLFTANIIIFAAWLISIIVSFISVGILIGVIANAPGNSGGDVVNEILGIIEIFFASTIVSITSLSFWLIALVSSIAEIVFAGIAINKIKVYREANRMGCFYMTVSAAAITLFMIILFKLAPLVFFVL